MARGPTLTRNIVSPREDLLVDSVTRTTACLLFEVCSVGESIEVTVSITQKYRAVLPGMNLYSNRSLGDLQPVAASRIDSKAAASAKRCPVREQRVDVAHRHCAYAIVRLWTFHRR